MTEKCFRGKRRVMGEIYFGGHICVVVLRELDTVFLGPL